VPAFQQVADADLVAVLSSEATRAQAFADQHGIETGTADLAKFLETPSLEAVWITSPTFLHHRQAQAALKSGKHVLLEKPLAMNSQEGWELVDYAAESDRLLATGYQARYVPAHLTMKELIADGAIGDVSVARTYYGIHWPEGPAEWRRKKETAQWGALADIGTHHVDLIRMLLGEIAAGTAIASRRLGYETDDVLVAGLELESGALASLTISANVWTEEHTRVEIHGTRGDLVAVDTSPQGQGSLTLIRPDHEPEEFTDERPDAWVAQLETVTRAASGEPVAYATGADGARNLEILESLLPPEARMTAS
jgi:1,5-anhydro-D-fructose reductase (1,5-anhydro-D-mannitol-forming)